MLACQNLARKNKTLAKNRKRLRRVRSYITGESCGLLAAGAPFFPSEPHHLLSTKQRQGTRAANPNPNEIDGASLSVAFTDLEIEPKSMLGPEPHCPCCGRRLVIPIASSATLRTRLGARPASKWCRVAAMVPPGFSFQQEFKQ